MSSRSRGDGTRRSSRRRGRVVEIPKNVPRSGVVRDRATRWVMSRYEQGASIGTISRELGRSYTLARRLLLEAGVTPRSRGGGRRAGGDQQPVRSTRDRGLVMRRGRQLAIGDFVLTFQTVWTVTGVTPAENGLLVRMAGLPFPWFFGNNERVWVITQPTLASKAGFRDATDAAVCSSLTDPAHPGSVGRRHERRPQHRTDDWNSAGIVIE
jgi:AraC-like DNA-binding protein